MKTLLAKIKNSKRLDTLSKVGIYVFLFLYTFSLPSFSGRLGWLYISYALMAVLLGCTIIYTYIHSSFTFHWSLLLLPLFAAWALVGTIAYSHEFRDWFSIVLMAITFFTFLYSFKALPNINVALKIILLALLAFCVYFVVIYRNDFVNFNNFFNFRLGYYFDNVNAIGGYMMLGFGISLYYVLNSKWKTLPLYIISVLVFGIIGISTGSRTFLVDIALLTLLLVVVQFRDNKWLCVSFVLCFLGLFLLAINLPIFSGLKDRLFSAFTEVSTGEGDGSTRTRMLWQLFGLELGSNNLFIGYGMGGFSIVSGVGTYTHGNLAEIICCHGLIGAVIYYFFPVYLAYRLIKKGTDQSLFLVAFIIVIFGLNSFLSVYYYGKWPHLFLAIFATVALEPEKEKVSLFSTSDARGMKIIFYTGINKRGGAERVVANLIKKLNENGNPLVLINDYKEGEKPYEIPPEVKRYYLCDYTKSRTKIGKNMKAIKALRKIVEEEDPDLVVSFLGVPNMRIIYALQDTDRKVIVSVRNDPNYEYGKSFIKRKMVNNLFKSADGIVCQTKEESEYFSKRLQNRIRIILNPVNDSFRSTEWRGQDSREIVAVGRLAEQKNYPLLIDAFKKVSELDDSLTLSIYGGGEEKDSLVALIKEKGLESKVTLKGETDDLREAYASCHYYVLSSSFEGLPNTLMEAMSVGAPCIATNCRGGGPSYLLGDSKYGLLVDNGDVNALSLAMITLSGNEHSRLEYASLAKERSNDFDEEKIFDEWRDYFVEIANGK